MRAGHAFVLGSGIAGLSIAELLSRNGFRITLLETSAELGGDASRCTQNWLHTGWLYATLPSRKPMLGCGHALRLFQPVYGRVLPQETLNLDVHERGVSYPAASAGWFASERVHYLYAVATAELSLTERLGWRSCLERVAFPRLRQLGYDTTSCTTLAPGLSELLNYWESDPAGHSKYMVVRSTDAQINTGRVLDTLLGLLGRDARVIREADYSLRVEGGRSTIVMGGERYTPDLVVLATGKSIPRQLALLGREDLASNFRSICSPIVVLKHALELPNFIRFTPKLSETINHIKYDVRGIGPRSTIGSYEFYSADELPDISPFINRVCRRFDLSVADVANVYYGTKTELTGPAQRRYNHAIERVNGNTYCAIPGKFSQFPLLVHEFAQRLGLRTDIDAPARGRLRLATSATLPERTFATLREARQSGIA